MGDYIISLLMLNNSSMKRKFVTVNPMESSLGLVTIAFALHIIHLGPGWFPIDALMTTTSTEME